MELENGLLLHSEAWKLQALVWSSSSLKAWGTSEMIVSFKGKFLKEKDFMWEKPWRFSGKEICLPMQETYRLIPGLRRSHMLGSD